MNFQIEKSLEILENTPQVLQTWIRPLSEDWTHHNEGHDTWSVFDIVGHLIHGEKTDWMSRVNIILENNNGSFTPFDRFAQYRDSKGKSMDQLLREFGSLRSVNIEKIRKLNISEDHLTMKGNHPNFGPVTLRQLLSTWTVHDLNHLSQISRVMARQYENEVGPWKAYLGILKKK